MEKTRTINHNPTTMKLTPIPKNGEDETRKPPRPLADLDTIAGHEAAHAVVGYLVGLSCVWVIADKTGGSYRHDWLSVGFEEDLYADLAGIAWEVGGVPQWGDLKKSKFEDLDVARGKLKANPGKRRKSVRGGKVCTRGVEPCLKRIFRITCEIVGWFIDDIDQLGEELIDRRGYMSGREVEMYMRRNIKPRIREALDQLSESGDSEEEKAIAKRIFEDCLNRGRR